MASIGLYTTIKMLVLLMPNLLMHVECSQFSSQFQLSDLLSTENTEVKIGPVELLAGWRIESLPDGSQRFVTTFDVSPKRGWHGRYKMCSKSVDSELADWICSSEWTAWPVWKKDAGHSSKGTLCYAKPLPQLHCTLNCTECEIIIVGMQQQKVPKYFPAKAAKQWWYVRSEPIFIHGALDLNETRDTIYVEQEIPQQNNLTRSSEVFKEELLIREGIIGGIIHAMVCIMTVACICYTFLRLTDTPIVLSVFVASAQVTDSLRLNYTSTEMFTLFEKKMQWGNKSVFGCNDGRSIAKFSAFISADGEYSTCRQESKFGLWKCESPKHKFENGTEPLGIYTIINPWIAMQPHNPGYHHAVVVIGELDRENQLIRTGVRQCMRTYKNQTEMRLYLQNHQRVFGHVFNISSHEIIDYNSSTTNASNAEIIEETVVIIKKSDYDPIRDGIVGGLINGFAVSILIVSISWIYKRHLPATVTL